MSEVFDWRNHKVSRRTIDIGKRTVSSVVTSLPSEHSNGRTVLLVPGLASGTAVFGPFARQLNIIGYQTCVMGHDTVDNGCEEDIMAVSDLLLSGELGLTVLPGNLSLAVHSLGAIHTVRGLSRRPDIASALRYLALAAPAGYGGVRGVGGALSSVTSEMRHRPTSPEIGHIAADAVKYALAANLRLGRQVRTARKTSIIGETQQLAQNGLDVLALLYPNDRLINPTKSADGLTQAGITMIRHVDGDDLGHNAHLFHPERVVRAAMQAIGEIEERHARAS
jgi:hypothetical protein